MKWAGRQKKASKIRCFLLLGSDQDNINYINTIALIIAKNMV